MQINHSIRIGISFNYVFTCTTEYRSNAVHFINYSVLITFYWLILKIVKCTCCILANIFAATKHSIVRIRRNIAYNLCFSFKFFHLNHANSLFVALVFVRIKWLVRRCWTVECLVPSHKSSTIRRQDISCMVTVTL